MDIDTVSERSEDEREEKREDRPKRQRRQSGRTRSMSRYEVLHSQYAVKIIHYKLLIFFSVIPYYALGAQITLPPPPSFLKIRGEAFFSLFT